MASEFPTEPWAREYPIGSRVETRDYEGHPITGTVYSYRQWGYQTSLIVVPEGDESLSERYERRLYRDRQSVRRI